MCFLETIRPSMTLELEGEFVLFNTIFKKQNPALSDEVFIFNRKVCKPDFVPPPIGRFGNHLSGALHPMASRQVAYTILHELAPREVYRASSVALRAVSSYLTFSPSPSTRSVGNSNV